MIENCFQFCDCTGTLVEEASRVWLAWNQSFFIMTEYDQPVVAW